MKVTCPKCNSEEFTCTAHVAETWRCDSNGDFIEALKGDEQVTHKPNAGDFWLCYKCGAEAEAENHG